MEIVYYRLCDLVYDYDYDYDYDYLEFVFLVSLCMFINNYTFIYLHFLIQMWMLLTFCLDLAFLGPTVRATAASERCSCSCNFVGFFA